MFTNTKIGRVRTVWIEDFLPPKFTAAIISCDTVCVLNVLPTGLHLRKWRLRYLRCPAGKNPVRLHAEGALQTADICAVNGDQAG